MGAGGSRTDNLSPEPARHYPHDQQDRRAEDEIGVSDYTETDVDSPRTGPTTVHVKDKTNPPIGNSMGKETYNVAVCRPDSVDDCRSCVPKLKFPLSAPEAVTFPGPINDYEGESKAKGSRKLGHYSRRMCETTLNESEVQSTKTVTTDGGWPTEYLDWLKKDQGLASGRKDIPKEQLEAAVAAAAVRAELRAEKASKELEQGGLGSPLLGGDTKELARQHGSNIKGKLFVLGLFLLLLLWLGGGGYEVSQWYTEVKEVREERAEAAAAQEAEERVEAEKAREAKAAAEKAAAERAAWMKKMHKRLAAGGVPVALVIVGMLLVAVAVGYCA